MKTLYKIVEDNLHNGYIKNLFAWIEWVIVTGVVLAVGIKVHGSFIIIACILGCLLYASALIGVVTFFGSYASQWHIQKTVVMPIALFITTVASAGIFYILVVALVAALKT